MSTVVIVPARLASTRFPEKVLASATGRPLVQHVVDAARGARCVGGAGGAGRVVVAADDARIAAALRPFGTEVILTRVDHANGTSRLGEAAAVLGLREEDVVINAQGDEPELDAHALDAALAALEGTAHAAIGTVATPITSARELADPNVVKVVRRVDGTALYFSRAGIPVDRDEALRMGRSGTGAAALGLRHVGVYAYRVNFLRAYAELKATALEELERLEQLRALEHGYTIAVELCRAPEPGVDTPEQYAAFVERWRKREGERGG
ncbi:3-deoxy-manno-octulosonate cytidylyltransferase [soil metagenome]